MTRWIPALLLAGLAPLVAQDKAQDKKDPPPQPPAKKQGELKTKRPEPPASEKMEVPPEEDTSISVKEYSFNPLQAEHELQVGNFYFKQGKYRSAAGRYTEATKWNEGYAAAWLRLGEAQEKLKDKHAASQAYTRYLAVATDAKNAPEIRKKLEKLK